MHRKNYLLGSWLFWRSSRKIWCVCLLTVTASLAAFSKLVLTESGPMLFRCIVLHRLWFKLLSLWECVAFEIATATFRLTLVARWQRRRSYWQRGRALPCRLFVATLQLRAKVFQVVESCSSLALVETKWLDWSCIVVAKWPGIDVLLRLGGRLLFKLLQVVTKLVWVKHRLLLAVGRLQ